MKASFMKLRDGSWGLRITHAPNEVVQPGTSVTAFRKDGSAESKTIGMVVWSGDDKSTPGMRCSLVTMSGGRASRWGRDFKGKECPRCESEELDARLSCWECGYRGTA